MSATAAAEPIEMKLRSKYLVTSKPKFGGKKRKASNEGRTGKSYRSRQRSLVPGNHKKGCK